MTIGTGYSEEDIALAGEYALDLLTAGERQTFETRLAAEPNLRRLVLEWDEGLSPLTDSLEPVEPPAMIRARIEAQLFGSPATGRGWFRPWMGAVGGALAAAAVVLAVILIDPAAPTLPTHRADITASDGAIRISANLNADTGTISLNRLSGAARPGRAIELWILLEGDSAPKSLGLLDSGDSTELTLAPGFRDRLEGAILAISDEPAGGSPTGSPTGDTLAVGSIAMLADT